MAYTFEKQFEIIVAGEGPSGVRISPDGLSLFVLHRYDKKIVQYNLSVAFDISTAITAYVLYIPYAENSGIFDFAFSPSGMNMYVIGFGHETYAGKITEYALTTPYSFPATYTIPFMHGIDAPRSIEINADFSKIFTNDGSTNINEFGLSTPYLITTSALMETVPITQSNGQIRFLDAGLSLFVCTGNYIGKYTLATAYDLTTLSVPSYILEQDYTPYISRRGFCFSADHTKIIVIEYDSNDYKFYARQYDTGYPPYNSGPPSVSAFWTNFHGLREEA